MLDIGTGLSDQAQHFQNKNFNGRLVMNKCIQCGSTSYKPIIKRDDQGVMRASGQYQCTGCKLVFATLDEWRHGQVRHSNTENMLPGQPQNRVDLS
jgi:hypothetical protein